VLDAELIVPDERGHPSFDRVRNRAVRRNPRHIAAARAEHPACLCVFDVLWWNGQDVRSWPLVDRKVYRDRASAHMARDARHPGVDAGHAD
jgi:ATP-dependent DNA ligase